MFVHVNKSTGAIVYSVTSVSSANQALTTVGSADQIDWETVLPIAPQVYHYVDANRQLWTRPIGHTHMFIYCLGSGAGGGTAWGGYTVDGGGGGGGSSAIVSWEGPALWDNLWVFAAPGGAAGNPGVHSYVSTYDTSTTSDLLVISGTAVPEHGGNGVLGGGGGIGGTAGTVSLPTSLGKLGTSIHYAGVLGAEGAGGGEVGHSLVALAGGPTTGGAGGGGYWSGGGQYAGGDITGAGSLITTIDGGAIEGGAGNPGYSTMIDGIMPLSTGGSGGGAHTGDAGGIGGVGGYGSGGGGGGVNSSIGGAGGNGVVTIISW